MTTPEPTSTENCGPKLQFMWQRVDAHPTICLNLELVCGVPDLQGTDRGPRAHLGKGCEPTGGGQLELKIRERPPSTLRNVDGGAPGGAGGRSGSGHHQS
jgi:hypothetical protein